MNLRRHPVRVLATTTAAALALALGVTAPSSAQPRRAAPTGTAPVLVTTAVVAPLHLTAGPGERSLYVADAFPGAVVRVDLAHHGATRTATVATDLGFAPGVALQGRRVHVVRTAGQGGPLEQSPTYLSRVTRTGGLVDLVDLLALERRLNPDGQVPGDDAESNPYDVIAYRGGFIVADAAANALVRVAADGTASVLTAFPNVTTGPCAGAPNQGTVGCDPVPTGLDLGPDGYLYVSGLGSFVAGQLWKVDPRTGAVVATLTTPPGSPPLTDVAVAGDGTVYVSSIVAGAVYRLAGGAWTSVALEAAAGLEVVRGVLYVGTAPAALGGEGEEPPAGPPPPGGIWAVPAGAFA